MKDVATGVRLDIAQEEPVALGRGGRVRRPSAKTLTMTSEFNE